MGCGQGVIRLGDWVEQLSRVIQVGDSVGQFSHVILSINVKPVHIYVVTQSS